MTDWWNQPIQPGGKSAASAGDARACPWCGAPAGPTFIHCTNCGAVIDQSDDLGGLLVPGVTGLDPEIQRSRLSSPLIAAQGGLASVNMVGAVGGTGMQMAVAAAILAKEHFTPGPPQVKPEDLGKPSQVALNVAQRLRADRIAANQPDISQQTGATPPVGPQDAEPTDPPTSPEE
jgi:hypothetical protein